MMFSLLFSFSIGLGSRLKQIRYQNGTTMNRGCTVQTKMCKEHAHFDSALNVRIDTPPCCMHHVLTVCENFSKEMRKHNVLHSVIYGAVLGYVRNKQMTPYDHDVDITVDGKFWRTDLFYTVIKDLDTLYGHKVTYHGIGGKTNILIHYSHANDNAIDVWPFYENTKDNIRMISIPHYDGMRVPYDMMFPSQLLGISGIKANFPNNPTSYVLRIYGEKAIKNERTCKTMDGANCLT